MSRFLYMRLVETNEDGSEQMVERAVDLDLAEQLIHIPIEAVLGQEYQEMLMTMHPPDPIPESIKRRIITLTRPS